MRGEEGMRGGMRSKQRSWRDQNIPTDVTSGMIELIVNLYYRVHSSCIAKNTI